MVAKLITYNKDGSVRCVYENVVSYTVLEFTTLHDMVFSWEASANPRDEDIDLDLVDEIVDNMIHRLDHIDGFCNDDELYEVYRESKRECLDF